MSCQVQNQLYKTFGTPLTSISTVRVQCRVQQFQQTNKLWAIKNNLVLEIKDTHLLFWISHFYLRSTVLLEIENYAFWVITSLQHILRYSMGKTVIKIQRVQIIMTDDRNRQIPYMWIDGSFIKYQAFKIGTVTST